jgi:hypothetical protein
MHMTGIQGASLKGVDMVSLYRRDPERARELENLGRLMTEGKDSEDQFLRLCELLLYFGENDKAKSLLVANASPGDRVAASFHKHFPDDVDLYAVALKKFEEQFNTRLTLIHTLRFLSQIFSCKQSVQNLRHDDPLSTMLGSGKAEVQITYVAGVIIGDVYIPEDNQAVPLSFRDGGWTFDAGGLGKLGLITPWPPPLP